MLRRLLLLGPLVLLVAVGSYIDTSDCPSLQRLLGVRGATTMVDGHRYDEQTALSVHNAYGQPEGIFEQLAAAGMRSLELDIQPGKRGRPELSGDWYVFHRDLPYFDESRCERLSDCLAALAAFRGQQPRHLPLTVFVDLKQPFAAGHAPEDFDAQLERQLGAGVVFTPAELVGRCPGARSPREAVERCGWPTVGELRGRILVALTGGASCEADQPLAGYAPDAAKALARRAFLAPAVEGQCGLAAYQAQQPFAVFFNLDWDHRDLVMKLRPQRLITRLYGGLGGALDDGALVSALDRERPTFLVTDRLEWP